MPTCYESEFFDTPFNYREFNVALSSKKSNASSRINSIDYETIKNLPIKYHLILLDIFNELFAAAQYPENWKKHMYIL